MNNVALNEKFVSSVLPTELFSAGYFDGQEMFTSVQLRNEFINIIKRNKILNPVRDILIHLVDSWVILPVYTSSNLITFLTHKVWKKITRSNYGTVAFYAPSTNRVYILFEHQVTLSLQFDEEFLIQILLHEIQHLCAKNLKIKYYDIMHKLFDSWYKHFFNAYFKTNKVTEKMVHDIVHFIYVNCETSRNMFVSASYFKKYQDMVMRLCDKCGINHEIGRGIFKTVVLYYNEPDLGPFIRAIKNNVPPYVDVYLSCMEAYKKLGYYKLNTIPGQEFLVPSEISCMTTMTKPLPQHYEAIRLLSNLKVKPIIKG